MRRTVSIRRAPRVIWGTMPQWRSSGMPRVDAQHDFLRARRRATVAKLVARLRGEPDDVGVILPTKR